MNDFSSDDVVLFAVSFVFLAISAIGFVFLISM